MYFPNLRSCVSCFSAKFLRISATPFEDFNRLFPLLSDVGIVSDRRRKHLPSRLLRRWIIDGRGMRLFLSALCMLRYQCAEREKCSGPRHQTASDQNSLGITHDGLRRSGSNLSAKAHQIVRHSGFEILLLLPDSASALLKARNLWRSLLTGVHGGRTIL